MLRFIDGFDHYQTADITKKWTILNNAGGVFITPGAGRRGGGALTLPLGVTFRYLAKVLDAQATWIIGMAFKPGTLASESYTLVGLYDAGSQQCDLRMYSDGTLVVTRAGTPLTGGTSTLALSTGIYSHIEWKVTISNSIGVGTCKVRVNGLDWITVATGQDTQATSNATANQVRLGPSDLTFQATGTWAFDDITICDGQGSVNNDFLGDVAVEPLYPNGAGHTTGWSATGPANWSAASEQYQDADATYNSASTAGLVDTYAMQNPPGVLGVVRGIQWVGCLRKDDASSYVIHRMVRSGGSGPDTDYEGSTAHAPNTDYAFFTEILETDPATGVAWVAAGLNLVEAGLKLVSIT